MYIFLVGNYIRRKGENKAVFRLGCTWILCIVIVSCTAIYCQTTALYSYVSFPIVIASICCFMLFLNFPVNNDKLGRMISFWARNTLGVYLIHDNFLVRQRIWSLTKGYSGFGVILVVFIFCTLLDKLRQYIFRLCRTDRLCHFIERKFIEFKTDYKDESS